MEEENMKIRYSPRRPYRYEIGTIQKGGNSSFKVLSQIVSQRFVLGVLRSFKAYECECMVCHSIKIKEEVDFERLGCPFCSGRMTNPEYNSIAVTNPEYIPIFAKE